MGPGPGAGMGPGWGGDPMMGPGAGPMGPGWGPDPMAAGACCLLLCCCPAVLCWARVGIIRKRSAMHAYLSAPE
jgi:hypothetical protein